MTSYDAVVGIAATVTAGGRCTAVRDDNLYPTGIEVSDEQMNTSKTAS